ncbi:FAD-binding and (Fe-S)-binding domain-containing protein [Carboxylicivirga sp. RSCT41]|uniref:FAD-binding and (Fe-S)-binding domain-containing protein n=1 Tax=Carboxylicivirga agarovorans TaxID=3417570 RepID=UPI003D341785
MLTGEYKSLYQSLSKVIDTKRMFHDTLHTLAFGTDASFYRLIPKLVIKAKNVDEVIAIMEETSRRNIPVTYRAGGTSLSGQAISDSVLVIAGEHWKEYEVLDNGERIRLQPGLTGARANAILAPYKRKMGPDPASINAAMIGGIAANNASGMCCGTSENSYKTVDSMKIVFRDGAYLDTGCYKSREEFTKTHKHIIDDIDQLVQAVKGNEPLTQRIKDKFKMKNTTGYSLNAFVDFSDPFDVIEHIMIGSEGTLGFIAEITYKTVIEHAHKASSLMVFPDIEKACNAVSALKSSPVSAVELIDRAGLRSVEDQDGVPAYLKTLSKDASAILVETRASDRDILKAQIDVILDTIKDIPSELPLTFTDIPAEFNALWKIRKGLFPSVGAIRKTGTTVIIEDVTFPVPKLASATLDLQELFASYGYSEAVIFGHALEGNLHFVFTQDLGAPEEVERYDAFMKQLVKLVIDKYDGALKAEHGTGRNMAPFVEKEWGNEAYLMMKEIKAIFDPEDMLNPGVILNNDPESHLKNLKPLPPAMDKVDKCIECGFCEPTCVANELTLSPRQRITTFREISRLKDSGEKPHEASSLVNAYQYAGDETCATDGLCALSCPVKINTGELIKELRFQSHTASQNKVATWLASNMDTVTGVLRNALGVINFGHTLLGSNVTGAISKSLYSISGQRIPLWNKYMPKGSKKIVPQMVNKNNPNKVVYFPSCINRSMGPSKDQSKDQVTLVFERLMKKAGFEVIYPESMNKLCCGMSYSSKGFKEQGLMKSTELERELKKASENGKYPVVCDMSPCLYTMKENMQDRLKLYEPVEFILEYLKDKLLFEPIDETVSVFAVCSMKKMGMDEHLLQLANMCATKVVKPDTNCCGFAGDRGFSFPELNEHGLRDLKIQLPHDVKHGYSTSRTCEIGLSKNSGISHESIVYLVDKVTRPLKQKAAKAALGLAIVILGGLGMQSTHAQDKPSVKLSGFVSTEAIFDSRKVVSARDGDVILYPAPISYDENGVDINEKGDFSFLSIHSRLRAKAGGVKLWGGQLSGLIEFDFVGTTNASIGLLRMRHAMAQLDFEKTSILFGQYWHPMFVTSCFPEISSWGAAAPVSVLSRNPQIRVTHQLTDKFRVSVAAVSQFDFKSSGPNGASNVYLRQSSMPEFDAHLEYGTKGKSVFGMVAGTKKIVPRRLNAAGNVVDESLRTYHALAYTTLKLKSLKIKLQAMYAQNGSDMLLLGGYGVKSIDAQTETYTYTPLSTLNYWTEIITHGSKVNFGIFAGIANQLGSSDTIADGNEVYARGSNIDYVARIAPRIITGTKDIKVMLELNQTYAAYGEPDEKFNVNNSERVVNTRLQLHVMYKF